MQCPIERLRDVLVLTRPSWTPEKIDSVTKRLTEKANRGEWQPERTRVWMSNSQIVNAAVILSAETPQFWILGELAWRPECDIIPESTPEKALDLLNEAMAVVHSKNIKQLSCRVRHAYLHANYAERLQSLGLKRGEERFEFRSPLASLPAEDGTPLAWFNMSRYGLEKTAALFAQVGQGAPDWDPEDDPAELIQGYMSDPLLKSGDDCVHIGQIDGQDAAVVIAQVDPRDGWSRITYMGLAPRFRGQGLGKWVHRHGFEMMKQQGGQLYHGGTAGANHAMLKLFRQHGCKDYLHLVEFSWKRRGDD